MGEAAIAYGVGSTAAYGMIQDLAKLIIGMNRWIQKLFGKININRLLGTKWGTDCICRNFCIRYCVMGHKRKIF